MVVVGDGASAEFLPSACWRSSHCSKLKRLRPQPLL